MQAQACFGLAQSLKGRGEQEEGKKGAELTKEAETYFDRVIDKFADVKRNDDTLGDMAKRELFELRNLAIGKVVPDIEGIDADGKKFKLSDYRGKVVLLDFWAKW